MCRIIIAAFIVLLTVAPLASTCTPGEDIIIKGQGSCEIRCHCSWAGTLCCVPYKC
jgi:hypothetical protein